MEKPVIPRHKREETLPGDALDLLERLCEIGAPTGQEDARALYIREWLEAIRPGAASIDADGSVLVDLAGNGRPAWLLDAHIDTVFSERRETVVKEGTVWRCPGVYDNTVSCMLLMLLARKLILSDAPAPLLITLTTGEEGEGNLRGMRGVMTREAARICGAYAFDLHQAAVTVGAVGSERFRCAWKAEGGHSWKDFGRASAISAMAKWTAAMDSLMPWKNGRLSYNLGEIRGGSGINMIAAECEVSVEIRSPDPSLLASAVSAAKRSAGEMAAAAGIQAIFHPIGTRPAGTVPPDWIGLKMLRHVHQELGLGWNGQINSTNANAILSAGVAGTCTGLACGGNVHTREEWLDTASLGPGWRKLLALTRRICEEVPAF